MKTALESEPALASTRGRPEERLARRCSVLHISTADNLGGSARSAYRLHLGLRRLGIRSRMLVGWKTTDDPEVDCLGVLPLRLADRLTHAVMDRFSLQDLFSPSALALPMRRWFREADVIQLYNTHGGYFSHTVLPALSRRRPLVWRLSDMWPMTGHCTYSLDCERWKSGCGACPLLWQYPALRHDRTAWLWRIKQQLYQRSWLTLVAPSRWIASLAARSPLLNRFPLHVIPNGLDTALFRQIPKSSAREALGLRNDRTIILFGAQTTSDPRKGRRVLQEALGRLDDVVGGIELLVIGEDRDDGVWPASCPVRRLGRVQEDRVLAQAYSAADLFVLPTLADNLPNEILESMACGTPVVSCRVGGVPEVVRHMETGYLAAPGDAQDLATGIRRLLADEAFRIQMGQHARRIVEQDHSLDVQARRFLDVYRHALAEYRRRTFQDV